MDRGPPTCQANVAALPKTDGLFLLMRSVSNLKGEHLASFRRKAYFMFDCARAKMIGRPAIKDKIRLTTYYYYR